MPDIPTIYATWASRQELGTWWSKEWLSLDMCNTNVRKEHNSLISPGQKRKILPVGFFWKQILKELWLYKFSWRVNTWGVKRGKLDLAQRAVRPPWSPNCLRQPHTNTYCTLAESSLGWHGTIVYDHHIGSLSGFILRGIYPWISILCFTHLLHPPHMTSPWVLVHKYTPAIKAKVQ